MGSSIRVAIAGAGIYGATTAIYLAKKGYNVTLFDPLGIMNASSAINQYRIHSGYHYPRSPKTIAEILAARDEFIQEYSDAVVEARQHLYAMPKSGSRISVEGFITAMNKFGLPLDDVRPKWMNFNFIDICWKVKEYLYDPYLLKRIIETRIERYGVKFFAKKLEFSQAQEKWDFIVWATYGLYPKVPVETPVQLHVAEKILFRPPCELKNISLVLVDGPFTAFDPLASSGNSLFGSAKYTNHWVTDDLEKKIPSKFRTLLNKSNFSAYEGTRFSKMREECQKTVPGILDSEYLGSRFVLRVIKNNIATDERTLSVSRLDNRNIHIFSGKVVGAIKAAKEVAECLSQSS